MKKRRIKKACKKFIYGKKISPLESKEINKHFNILHKHIFKNRLLGSYRSSGLSKPLGINPFIENKDEIIIPEINKPPDDFDEFRDFLIQNLAIIFQVPVHILRGEYNRDIDNQEEVKMDIFKKEYGESHSVEDRLYDVKSCNDLLKLTEALDKPGLQKTVEKAILSKIKKLNKEVKK